MRGPGTCVVRYFEHGDPQRPELGALVYEKGRRPRLVEGLDAHAIRGMAERLAQRGAPERGAPERRAPDRATAAALWEFLVTPLGDVWDAEHLVIIPAGPIFQLPLHVAYDGKTLLGARVALSFSVSATAFLTGRRHLLRWQPIDADDDLCALIPHYADKPLSAEDVNVPWPKERFYIAGARPHGLDRSRFKYVGKGNLEGLQKLASVHPELFVYVGHGRVDDGGEPLLQLEAGGLATPYALLTPYLLPGEGLRTRSARLVRNKWTILSGCVTGQQADLAGGEVAGFVRAFTAVGAGALVLALWPVLSTAAADTTRALLSSALEACREERAVDIVGELRDHYAGQQEQSKSDVDAWIERCPFAVYL